MLNAEDSGGVARLESTKSPCEVDSSVVVVVAVAGGQGAAAADTSAIRMEEGGEGREEDGAEGCEWSLAFASYLRRNNNRHIGIEMRHASHARSLLRAALSAESGTDILRMIG
jgi:hypothetical protein